MAPSVFCGVDPGLSGSIAFVGGNAHSVCPLQLRETDHGQDELDTTWLAEILEAWNPRAVAVELVQGFGGVSSAFKLGQSYGGIICTTLAGRFRLERVRPQAWQSVMLPGVHGRDELKRASVKRARELFPDLHLTKRGRCKPDDQADALLIAEYLRRTLEA